MSLFPNLNERIHEIERSISRIELLEDTVGSLKVLLDTANEGLSHLNLYMEKQEMANEVTNKWTKIIGQILMVGFPILAALMGGLGTGIWTRLRELEHTTIEEKAIIRVELQTIKEDIAGLKANEQERSLKELKGQD